MKSEAPLRSDISVNVILVSFIHLTVKKCSIVIKILFRIKIEIGFYASASGPEPQYAGEVIFPSIQVLKNEILP